MPALCSKRRKVANTKGSLITPALTSSIDRVNISGRKATIVFSAAIKAVGGTSENYVLNKKSVRKARRRNREKVAKPLKQSYKPLDPFVVHWDDGEFNTL